MKPDTNFFDLPDQWEVIADALEHGADEREQIGEVETAASWRVEAEIYRRCAADLRNAYGTRDGLEGADGCGICPVCGSQSLHLFNGHYVCNK